MLGQTIQAPNNIWRFPSQPKVIAWHLLFHCCVMHPSIMVRRTVYKQLEGYRREFLHAEDYELLLRACLNTKMANLSDVYLKYRKHSQSVSHTFKQTQIKNSLRAQRKAMETLLTSEVPTVLVHMLSNHYPYRPPAPTSQHYQSGANLLAQLYHIYVDSTTLSKQEKVKIQDDVLSKLLKLSRRCRRIAPMDSLKIWKKGMMIFPERRWRFFILFIKALAHRLVS